MLYRLVQEQLRYFNKKMPYQSVRELKHLENPARVEEKNWGQRTFSHRLQYPPASPICQRDILREKPTGAAGYLPTERRLISTGTLPIKPITRLYFAGEISSICGHLYLEAGNITECFVAGKIAGQNAAAEKAWN